MYPQQAAGVTGVHLLCGSPHNPAANLTSLSGVGTPRPVVSCNSSDSTSRAVGFAVSSGYITNATGVPAVDMIKFACSNTGNITRYVEAYDGVDGDNITVYSTVSSCPYGLYICGMQTAVFNQTETQAVAIADVRFACCGW